MALNMYMRMTANGTAVTYRMDAVKLNGRHVNHLRELNMAGRLEFAASPAQSHGVTVGAFREAIGLDSEREIGDPRYPADGLVVVGRVMSAISKIDSITLKIREEVTVNIDTPQKCRVAFVPAEIT